MILNKQQIKLLTQLLGNRIAELERTIGLDESLEIKRKNHKYLIKELELANSMLDEIIQGTKEYTLITEDSVEKKEGEKVYSVENNPFLIDTIMCLTVSDNIKDLYPRRMFFSTIDVAENYIAFNKTCLSINEIAVIIGECNRTTYICLDTLTKKLKNFVISKKIN